MKVAILCGGKGTRLAELTEGVPKGLIPIGGRPIVWHIMKYFEAFGHRDFVLLVGYKATEFVDYFAAHRATERTITFVNSGIEASKSERLRDARPLLDNDRFFLSYGDDLTDVDLDLVLERNTMSSAVVTLTAVRPPNPFGSLKMDTEGNVTALVEKGPLTDWINGGYMVVRPAIFEDLSRGELESGVLPYLAQRGEVNAHKHHGFWMSMNTYKEFLELDRIWQTGDAPWQRWSGGAQ